MLTLAMAFASAAMLPAQNVVIEDDGNQRILPATSGGGLPQGSGVLCTDFNSNNGFAGNMFDIAPTVDMEITAIDVNVDGVGQQVDVDVWYIPGTSFGNEDASTGWTLLGSYTGTSVGADLQTFIDMVGNGVAFTGGQTYGIYVDITNYSEQVGGVAINYTNGNLQGNPSGNDAWSNSDLTITANAGKGDGGHAGLTFYPRNWNGCIHYNTSGGGSFTLSNSGSAAGGMTTITTANGSPGTLVYVCYSLTGGGPTASPYGVADLTMPIRAMTTQTADAGGATSIDRMIPSSWAGQTVYLQALNVTGAGVGVFSNQLVETIL